MNVKKRGRLIRNLAGASLQVLALNFLSVSAMAQSAVMEEEPNETPADALRISSEATIIGSMSGNDQDAFLWTVSDVDALNRWTFKLHGVPGRLTIVEIVRLQYGENGTDIVGFDKLMKMGTRDGLKPSIHENLMFEPGEYLLGIAGAGGGGEGGIFRPPDVSLSFGEADKVEPADAEPGGYRLTISRGTQLPVTQKPKDRSTQESAHAMRIDAEYSALTESPENWYRFPFKQQHTDSRWTLFAQVPVGREISAKLFDSEQSELANASSDSKGKLIFPELSPPEGDWFVQLDTRKHSGFLQAISSSRVGDRVEGEESEPNDKWARANQLDSSVLLAGSSVKGRVNKNGETDWFRFSVDAEQTDSLLQLMLTNAGGQQVEFCLHDSGGNRLQCRKGNAALPLPDLVLMPGDYGLSVSRGKQGTEYAISMLATGEIDPAVEAEPNDSLPLASSVPSKNRVKGNFSGKDADYFRFVITDEPQLWRFQVIGDSVEEVAYLDSGGSQAQRVRPKKGQRRVRLENVYLLPGVHHLMIRGADGGNYTLLARKLGPPDPNGEREPNNDTSRMQNLAVGQSRTGLLLDQDDHDLYRFFLANEDHVRLTITPPPDGSVQPSLYWYGKPFKETTTPAAGQVTVLEGLLPPGDYHFSLAAPQPSDAEYTVKLERLERFSCTADCEPNDNPQFASPLHPGITIHGQSGDWRDPDVYALPVRDEDTEWLIRVEPRLNLSLKPLDNNKSVLSWDSTEKAFRGVVPAGTAHYLWTGSNRRDYQLEASYVGMEPVALPGRDLEVDAQLVLETQNVSAYRRNGQRVSGQLELQNLSGQLQFLTLQTVSSDYRWLANTASDEIELGPEQSISVPVDVRVPADAWADWPVRISIRVGNATGQSTETYSEIFALRETASVNPEWGWHIPAKLRGGFNLAWAPLGSQWVGTYDSSIGANFQGLLNGIDVYGLGMNLRGRRQEHPPHDIVIELAGGRVSAVAGAAISLRNLRSIGTDLSHIDMALSLDGETFDTVLQQELSPIKTDQYFMLNKPVQARFARLRLEKAFSGKAGDQIHVGEWKVISEPGTDISDGEGFNLAAPGLGGHVVYSRPTASVDWDKVLLQDEDQHRSGMANAGVAFEFVLGFHHNRAAQINRVEWVPETGNTQQPIPEITLWASMDSPHGPWRQLAQSPIQTVPDNTIIELQQSEWVRFLKVTAPPLTERRWQALPERIEVWERPTSDDYVSILTEWGYGAKAAFFEFSQGFEAIEFQHDSGNRTKETAERIVPGDARQGAVMLGKYTHWYRLDVPANQNTISVELAGEPTVRTAVKMENSAGESVRLRKNTTASKPGVHYFEGQVEPGQIYFFQVEEPPRNVVFIWDTSPSVQTYIPTIYNALVAFSNDVVAGRDAVNLIPFGHSPLLRDWYGEPYILQTVLNDYPRRDSSSDAEKTLRRASEILAPLPGTKAIIAITDAATTRDAKVWDAYEDVRPRVFGIGVAGSREAASEQDLFEDWRDVNAGHYTHMVYDGEMEIAFDRAATLLKRPAEYNLLVKTEFREAPGPGSLQVLSGAAGVTSSGAVELILDASGSMLQRLDGKRRINIAKDVLIEAVENHVPDGTPLALRVFGHIEPNACRTDLVVPLKPLDAGSVAAEIKKIQARNLARTPIADSLAKIESDLKNTSGNRVIVLVTDGEETCEGQPEKVIQQLRDKGFDITLNIVGFAIDNQELEEQFKAWAELGGGSYFSANNEQGLSQAINAALQTPFTVFDESGTAVDKGFVDGAAVELPAGYYRVSVDSSPVKVFENVEVPGESSVTVELE